MKNIFFSILCCSGLLLHSCKKDSPIGDPVQILPDYVLPQGNASQAANDKIQQLYTTYGSYFLYVFTQKDYEWIQSTGTSNSAIDTAVLGNPVYVGDMLQFLDDVWLKFLPDDFKKKQGIPYRVLMADTIKQRRAGSGYPPGMEYLYYDYKVTGKAITFAGMNNSLRTMSAADKVTKKNALTGAIWNYYLSNGIVTFPNEFFTVSNYVTQPTTPVSTAYPANREAYRNGGFLPSGYLANGNTTEWLTNAYSWSTAKANDQSSFLLHLLQRTDAQMQPYLTSYPLIKKKFDILVNHFKTKYNIDVRAIANATY